MNTAILGLGTAVPSYEFSQEDIAQKSIEFLALNSEKIESLKKIYQNSSIQKRHCVVSDFQKDREEWAFWGKDYPQIQPSMTERNLCYKQEAPKLSEQAARQALEEWGGEVSQITHIISVSCTGVIAPGIEYYLMQNLGLPHTVDRLGINFMGCFGAFKGLSVARAFAQANPKARILLVCTELCSLHYQTDDDHDNILANSLFSDGAAAAVIGSDLEKEEKSLWNIVSSSSIGFKNSLEKMSWEASHRGFLIRLSASVPVLIGRNVKEFVNRLLAHHTTVDQCEWAIHPGGKSILQVIERELQLTSNQTQSSWDILKDYGNMSSATFLFVLKKLSQQLSPYQWTAGLGFGPGLSAEGILLKRPTHKENEC